MDGDGLSQRVFISYTLQDHKINVGLLSSLKETAKLRGIDTFIDIIDNKYGRDHQKNIFKWLADADALYLIETPKTYQSQWVKKELDFANKFNIPIIKVLLQDIKRFITTPADMTSHLFLNLQSKP